MKRLNDRSYWLNTILYYFVIVIAVIFISLTLIASDEPKPVNYTDGLMIVGFACMVGLGHCVASHFSRE